MNDSQATLDIVLKRFVGGRAVIIFLSMLLSSGCSENVRVKDGGDAGNIDAGSDMDTDVDSGTETDSDTSTDTDTSEFLCPDDVDCGNSCIRYVNGDVSSSGNGLSWSGAYKTLQEGIDAAYCGVTECTNNESCQVWAAKGKYNVWKDSREDTLNVRPWVELYGGFDGTETTVDQRDVDGNEVVIDGHDPDDPNKIEQVYHVVTIQGNAIVLDGLTITGGRADGDPAAYQTCGGGIYIRGCTITLRNCRIKENSTAIDPYSFGSDNTTGGGIFGNSYGYETAGQFKIENCVFENNTAGVGGAIYLINMPSAVISGSVFSENQAFHEGGAIKTLNSQSQLIVSDNLFVQNSTDLLAGIPDLGGGALSLEGWYSNSLVIKNNLFEENSSKNGGAIDFKSEISEIVFENNLFFGNTAVQGGGAVYMGMMSVIYDSIFTNSTFVENDALNGGALYVCNASSLSSVEIWNSILWNNSGGSVYVESGSLDPANLSMAYCLVEGGTTGVGNINVDPLFEDAAACNYHLAPGSPCIDAADGDKAPTLDLEGNIRTDDPATADTGTGTPAYTDMGVYEYAP